MASSCPSTSHHSTREAAAIVCSQNTPFANVKDWIGKSLPVCHPFQKSPSVCLRGHAVVPFAMRNNFICRLPFAQRCPSEDKRDERGCDWCNWPSFRLHLKVRLRCCYLWSFVIDVETLSKYGLSLINKVFAVFFRSFHQLCKTFINREKMPPKSFFVILYFHLVCVCVCIWTGCVCVCSVPTPSVSQWKAGLPPGLISSQTPDCDSFRGLIRHIWSPSTRPWMSTSTRLHLQLIAATFAPLWKDLYLSQTCVCVCVCVCARKRPTCWILSFDTEPAEQNHRSVWCYELNIIFVPKTLSGQKVAAQWTAQWHKSKPNIVYEALEV